MFQPSHTVGIQPAGNTCVPHTGRCTVSLKRQQWRRRKRERERDTEKRTSRDGFNYCCLKHLKTINQQFGSGNHSSHGQPWWFGCGHVNPSEFHSDFTTWLHNGWCSDEGNHPRPWPYDDIFQVTTHCYHLGRFFMCVFCIPIYLIQTFTIDSP